MPWKKGQSGNPGGRHPVVGTIRALARQNSPKAFEIIVSIMQSDLAETAQRLSAAKEVLKIAGCIPENWTDDDEPLTRPSPVTTDSELETGLDS